MKIRVAVLGCGSWGTTVAHVAAHQVPTVLWSRRSEQAEEINATRINGRYLPDYALHRNLTATADLAEAVSTADVLVMGVPSQHFRAVLNEAAEHVRAWVPVLSLSKGFEIGTRSRMTEIIGEVLPGHPAAVLTGPNLAKEILAGDAAAAVVATPDPVVAEQLRQIFNMNLFRVYTNPDVVGCEVAGALKNVVAIAAGMADGLGAGDNTKATVITRGLAELSRLGVAMGGEFATFAGLAGMGDLIATCMSPQSRNRYVGEQLGEGKSIEQVIESMNMVAEGVKTSRVVMDLASEYGVDMPIASEVFRVCHEGGSAEAAYRGLLRLPTGPEHAS